MNYISGILAILFAFEYANASFSGPFLMWGYEKVKNMKLPALEAVEEKTLTTVFSEAKAIIMFLRNNTSKLDKENYPTFKELVNKNNNWAYLPQHTLPAEPLDYNSNVEVIPLVGPTSQQDVELTALFRDAVTIYGEGEVLGILANQAEDIHMIYKRESEGETLTSTISPTEEPIEENFIYISKDGKAMMHTTSAPELTIESEPNSDKVVTKVLKRHGLVTFDDRESAQGFFRIIIVFIDDDDGKVTLRFKFPLSGGYWTLSSVEVVNNTGVTALNTVGEAPSAPIGFSYACSKPLIFVNGINNLKFKSIQVQPALPKPNRFSDAYNCIGFTTVPIWSGIFVSFIVITVTFIGIIAILEIKPPTRFESNRNKQLTISIQE